MASIGVVTGIVSFLKEAKRRKVYVSAVAYIAISIGVIELANAFVPALELPEILTRVVPVMLLLFFPIVLVLAWTFDITTQGVMRTPDAAPDASATRRSSAVAGPLPSSLPRLPEPSGRSRVTAVDAPLPDVPDPIRLKRAVLGHMRHELRTPINGIVGYADLLLEDVTDAAIAADLRRIREAGRRLSVLVDEILNPDLPAEQAAGRDLEQVGAQIRADLRNPINAVIGYAELLIESSAESEHDHLVPDLQRIDSAARRLLELSGDIAQLATAGRDGVTPALAGTTQITSNVLAKIRPVAPGSATIEGEGAVLVVDDNALNRDLLSRQLARHGYIVDIACDGVEALERLADRAYDVILLDVIMPRLDGVETLQRIRADEKLNDVPVLMLSSLDEVDSAIRCIGLGAEEYLSKPFQPVLLEARIAANVSLRRMRARDRALREHLGTLQHLSSQLAHASLPPAVAARVLQGERHIEESAGDATALACVFGAAARRADDALVRLRQLAVAVERVAARPGVHTVVCRPHGCTILCLPTADSPQHARVAADVALELLAACAGTAAPGCGLHSGPMHAAVIGEHRPHYEVWGEAVETAEALALQATPGTALVSPTTQHLLGDVYRLEPRGVAEVRGRGHMKLFVLKAQTEPPAPVV